MLSEVASNVQVTSFQFSMKRKAGIVYLWSTFYCFMSNVFVFRSVAQGVFLEGQEGNDRSRKKRKISETKARQKLIDRFFWTSSSSVG